MLFCNGLCAVRARRAFPFIVHVSFVSFFIHRTTLEINFSNNNTCDEIMFTIAHIDEAENAVFNSSGGVVDSLWREAIVATVRRCQMIQREYII